MSVLHPEIAPLLPRQKRILLGVSLLEAGAFNFFLTGYLRNLREWSKMILNFLLSFNSERTKT